MRERFVELVDIDLRWGITAEQAEHGDVLPICLAEIERSRPYFVGLLGERYGWTPAAEAYAAELLEREPWLVQHLGGKSVTELEILHGVLNNPAMAGRALFYFRSPAYALTRGGDFLPGNESESVRQTELKNSIRASGFPLVEDYAGPSDLAERMSQDLWSILDASFPPEEVPDEFTRTSHQHEAYAAPRRGLYLGGEQQVALLNESIAAAEPRILIEGASGGGKSALIANTLSHWRTVHPTDLVHEHYLAATSDAADPVGLVRRLIEAIRRTTGAEEAIASEPQKLFESLPTWLATASAHAGHLGYRWIIAFDGLNGLADLTDLRWFPSFFPERVHLVVSCLPGPVLDALQEKAEWRSIRVEPLTVVRAEELLVRYLSGYNKTLSQDQLRSVLSHPLSTNPLFLRTLAEELRVFGVYEQLEARIAHYLSSETVVDLFERVLARIEEDCGAVQVQQAATGIWASRFGLSEKEIQGFADLVPAVWAPIRHALPEALLETNGRLIFAHDYLRRAVAARYLPTEEEQRQAHRSLAAWFAGQPMDARAAEELPWQWQHAQAWPELEQCLTMRSVFETICANRQDSSQEMLGYWLDLERQGRLAEDCYGGAWTTWQQAERADPSWQTTERQLVWAKLADKLSGFLQFAGRYGEPATSLATTALELRKTILGEVHLDTAEALTGYANLLRRKGDDRSALPYMRRALAIREKLQGPEHSDTAESIRNLGATLGVLGDYVEAELLLRRALGRVEENPDAAPNNGQLLNSLAVLLFNAKGDPRASEAMLQQALEMASRVKGPDSPGALAIFRNTGVIAADRGDLRRAESIYRHVLEVHQRTLGEDHPQTILSRERLARLLGDMGQFDASEELFWLCLNAGEKNLGRDHPSVAATLSNFAAMLDSRGHRAVAVPLLRRALKIEEHVYGPEHPNTLSVMNSLAVSLDMTGEEAAAEELYRRVLTIREKVLGPEHPATALSMGNLAGTIKKNGDVDGAILLLRKAAAIEEKVFGPEHPGLAATLENLAVTLHSRGDLETALTLQQRALAIREKTVGPDNPATSDSMELVAEILEKTGDYAGAEVLFRRALPIKVKIYGAESEKSLFLLEKIAEMATAQNDHQRARDIYQQSLDIIRKARGPDDFAVSVALVKLVGAMMKNDEYGNIEPYARRALEIVDAVKGPEHRDTIPCLDYLGLGLRAKGDLQGAVEIYRRALRVREKIYGAVCEETAVAHSRLADRLTKVDNPGEAEQHYRRALAIREQIDGPQDAEVGETAFALGSLCHAQDRFPEAEQWFRRALVVAKDDADVVKTCRDLGKTLLFLGVRTGDVQKCQEAADFLRQALEMSPRGRDPAAWAMLQFWLGTAMTSLAEFGDSRARHRDAMNAFAAALDVSPEANWIRERFDAARAAYENG